MSPLPKRVIREGVIIAESQNFARTLINEPGNRMTPTILGQRAAEMAAENRPEVRSLRRR